LKEVLNEAIEIYGQPVLAVLNRAEAGTAVPDLCWEHAISSASFYKWRSKFGMDVSLMTRIKEREEENRRLKTLYIEAQIKADIVREALAKNSKRISPTRGGHRWTVEEKGLNHPSALRGVWAERKRLSRSAEAQREERQDRQVVAAADGE
jgi:putative transposase